MLYVMSTLPPAATIMPPHLSLSWLCFLSFFCHASTSLIILCYFLKTNNGRNQSGKGIQMYCGHQKNAPLRSPPAGSITDLWAQVFCSEIHHPICACPAFLWVLPAKGWAWQDAVWPVCGSLELLWLVAWLKDSWLTLPNSELHCHPLVPPSLPPKHQTHMEHGWRS